MSKPIDITHLSAEETKKRLECQSKPVLCLVPWDRITFIQSREKTDLALVAEYEESLSNGDELPPSKGIYVYDLNTCNLYDGIHSGTARNNRGQNPLPVLLQLGTTTDADIAAAGANYSNGARRTNADKRSATALLIRNPETGGRSNNWIAKTAHVSPALVEEVRIQLENDPVNPVRRPSKRLVTRKGVEYKVEDPAAKKMEEQLKSKSPASGATAKQKTSAAAPKEILSKAESLTSEEIAQQTIGYLNGHLKTHPAGEHLIVCKLVIEALQTSSSLGNCAS